MLAVVDSINISLSGGTTSANNLVVNGGAGDTITVSGAPIQSTLLVRLPVAMVVTPSCLVPRHTQQSVPELVPTPSP